MQKDIVRLFGVSRVTVKNWSDDHGCPRNADDTYNLGAVIRWYGDWRASQASGPAPAKDRMRDAKAERLELQVAEQKGQLLDRQEVIAGLCARSAKLAGAFRYKRRELSLMLHGQTAAGIEDILGRFFNDVQNEMCTVPEQLKLPTEAEVKLRELLESMNRNGHE